MKQLARRLIRLGAAPSHLPSEAAPGDAARVQRLRVEREQRRLVSPTEGDSSPPEWAQTLDSDGILVLPEFFDTDTFARILDEVAGADERARFATEPNKDGFGVDWYSGRLLPPESPTVNAQLRRNSLIQSLVRHVSHRDVLYAPEVIYQRLTLPDGGRDESDRNTVLHCDRFYPTVKVFLLLSETTEENGAFVYCRGSHRLDAARLEAEVDYAERNARDDDGDPWVEKARRVYRPDWAERFEPRAIRGGPNTLVVANVAGLHRRGTMAPGTRREFLRMIFHYVHAPRIAQATLGLAGLDPARFLN